MNTPTHAGRPGAKGRTTRLPRAGAWLTLGLLAGGLGQANAQLHPPPAPLFPKSAPALVCPGMPQRLVIIAPAAYRPALRAFIAHKELLLPTEFQSLEELLQTQPGVDDPEKVKHFLYDEWHDHGLGFALLVGDVDVFPVRYMVLDRATAAAFDYAFYPSDLYYSDLAKADGSFGDWNGRRDGFHAGYFGEVRGEKNKTDPINYDGVAYRPQIAVGRWPVSTPEAVRLLAAKTIAYEDQVLTNAPAAAAPRAAFIAVGGWVDSRPLQTRLAAQMQPGWQVEQRFYGAPTNSATPPPDHTQVRDLFNHGLQLAIHAGHGSETSWDQCFSPADVSRLTNSNGMPVVMSAGCSTAHFAPLPPYEPYVDVQGVEHRGTDHGEVFTAPPPPPAVYQHGRYNPTCLAEQILLRENAGAVAYIGCNTGSQPCGLTLLEGFVGSLANTKEPRLGDCWATAIKFYYQHEHLATLQPTEDWYPPSIFFQGMKFMLFGDPSLRLPANRH